MIRRLWARLTHRGYGDAIVLDHLPQHPTHSPNSHVRPFRVPHDQDRRRDARRR